MPILQSEARVFPDDLLLPHDDFSFVSGHEWRVLHTKPRQEKALARELLTREIPFYLPTLRRTRPYGGRLRTSDLPLFDGYVFLFGNYDQYHSALTTQRIVRSLRVPDQKQFRSELRQLNSLLESGMTVRAESMLVPGQLVEVTVGPLAGLRGTVIRAAASRRFVIAVDFIGKGASVTCDELVLRPVDPIA
jgi:transcriptional antiterminator RfaH